MNTDEARTELIRTAIRKADSEIRTKFPLLNFQNTIGLIICIGCFIGMIGSGIAYYLEVIPPWIAIIVAAIFASVSHELEHDLIHRMYFRHQPLMQHAMMGIVWLMRPNTVNPWYRRTLHFNHHKVSGTENDLEERVLGNGMKFGLFRLLITLDGFLSVTLRIKELSKIKQFNYFGFISKGAPLVFIYVVGLYSFLLFHGISSIIESVSSPILYPEWLLGFMEVVNFLAVVWILPNAIRSISLHFITSIVHYYGGVNSVYNQCQVVNHWALLPFNLFCFNFGSTHVIHHFVVSQPFYIRQLISKKAHKVLREQGIRFNDLHALVRANHFNVNSLTGPNTVP